LQAMMKFISAADKYFDAVVKYLAYLAAAILVLMAVSITVDVILRFTFNYPLKWVFEATEYSLLFITFLAATWVLQKDQHVKLDLVLNLFGRKNQARINTFTSLVMAIVCLVSAWSSASYTLYLFQNDVTITKYYTIPQITIFIIIPIGFILLFIQSLKKAHNCFYHQTSMKTKV
jgi:TRAP-type C4-dicarboxylate transport system permease small subunit